MKALIKWAVKKFANTDKIKEAIHAANAKLAEREASDRTAKVMEYGNDASETTAVYLKAFANDGKVDAEELAAINAQDDKMVDKYLSDERIDAIVDAIFD